MSPNPPKPRAPQHGAACITCRRQGRRCDKTVPSCRTCVERGSLCEGYLLRWSAPISSNPVSEKQSWTPLAHTRKARRDFQSAGLFVSIDGPGLGEDIANANDAGKFAQSDGIKFKPPEITPFSCDAKPEGRFQDINSTAAIALLTDATKHYAIDPASIPDGLGHLVNYELRELASIFYLGFDPRSNPYVAHIYGLATTVAALRFAMAASASSHLATRLQDTKLGLQSLRLRTEATNLLRKRLEVYDPAGLPGSLATVLALAQLDMCSGYCTEFDIHLRAGRDIINYYHDFRPAPFLEQRLLWLDIMSCTTSSREPLFTWAEVRRYLDHFRIGRGAEWSLDSFPGTLFQFEMIASVTFCHKLQAAGLKSAEDARNEAAHEKQRLLQQKNPLTTPAQRHLVESFQAGALLYINGLFNLASDSSETQQLVSSILAHANVLRVMPARLQLLAWPLYQAGLDSKAEEETKTLIRHHFLSMVNTIGCRHGENGLQALEAFWSSDFSTSRPSVPAALLEGPLVLI